MKVTPPHLLGIGGKFAKKRERSDEWIVRAIWLKIQCEKCSMGDQFGHRREVESVDEKDQSLGDASVESGENLLSVTYEKINFIVLPISIIVGTFLGVLLVISILLLILRWYWKWGTNAKYTKLTSPPVMDTQTKNSADVNNTESRAPVRAASPSPSSSGSSTSSTILLTFPPPLAAITVTKTVLPAPQTTTPLALQSPKLPPDTPPSAGGPLTPQSPRADWLHSLQAELQHVQPRRQGSPSENKENTAPNSPLVASANYKHGNYFRFPEVDVWSPGAKAMTTPRLTDSAQNSPEVVTTPRDTLSVGLASPADGEMARNSPTARRARLKSISLDSESARFVEENLNVAMEELDLEAVQSPTGSKRNKHQLKIDIDSENLTDVDVRQPPTPKTPTLTQTRQKAVSLDSEPSGGVCKSKSQACVTGSSTASASVPTTPKRQQQTMSIHQPQRGKSRSTSDHLGSNLQRLKSVTLSVSNNNLKTLPEVMPLSDFGGTPQPPPTQPPTKVRSSLLQRRGSNHSLTLNLAGSVGDLASNTSLTGSMTTNAQPSGKKGLLQRRGSNASLTLTIQCSDSGLSRFNSHGSLNAATQSRKGLLSVSNTSLRGSACSLARLKGTAGAGELSVSGAGASHHRKFLSSENLLQRATHLTESLELEVDDATGVLDDDGGEEAAIRQITTKPLSPQSTSEDFKIYLANIQFLQNASNVLHMEDIREFDACFEELSDTQPNRDEYLMKQRRKIRQIHQEFWDLPTNHQEKPMVFGSQHKNRYKTILPNEHSRVILQPEDPESLQEPYINANYIKGPDGTHNAYIATQGPMPNTIYEFWLMVMQNVRRCGESGSSADQKIAMLTEFMESGRTKCAVYFPTEVNQVLVFANGADDVLSAHAPPSDGSAAQVGGDSMWLKAYLDMLEEDEESDKCIHKFAFVIENTGVTQKKGYSVRKLCVRHFDNDGKPFAFNVLHYWFPDWPDHRSPEDLGVVLDFALDLLGGGGSATSEAAPLPLLHCSAGIGRTGCMAGILNAVRQIDSTPVNPSVDILGIVCNLRLQRGGMVQNSEQYELIYRVVCLYQKRKDSMTHPPQVPLLLCDTLDF